MPVTRVTATDFLRAALAQAERGRQVFPLGVGSKLPKISKSAGGRGFYDATCDQDQIQAWWRRWPRANPGIRTGRASNLAVLDVDPRHRGGQASRLSKPSTAASDT